MVMTVLESHLLVMKKNNETLKMGWLVFSSILQTNAESNQKRNVRIRVIY